MTGSSEAVQDALDVGDEAGLRAAHEVGRQHEQRVGTRFARRPTDGHRVAQRAARASDDGHLAGDRLDGGREHGRVLLGRERVELARAARCEDGGGPGVDARADVRGRERGIHLVLGA